MKIGIIGGGVSGNVLAWHLHRDHDITLFEANDYLGGHTHTHDIKIDGQSLAVDSGFIVFNDWTYPNFLGLLDELGVETQPSEMSFSVRCERSGLEYSGSNLDTLFSQRRNLVNPFFYRMLFDILKFNRRATELLDTSDGEMTLRSFLAQGGYSRSVIDHYIVPMGAAIWSTDPGQMLEFPARFFIRFLKNHGLLSINDRPQWRVIKGGSRRYLDAMSSAYANSVRLGSKVVSVRRTAGRAQIRVAGGAYETFDHVFLACHSDQALAMLDDASTAETRVLGALPYQENHAVMHTDTSLLPRSRRAWAAWNYHIANSASSAVGVTYNMNILQGLDCRETILVTLNDVDKIDPSRVIRTMSYHHPLFTVAGAAAQQRHGELNGVRNTWYCGAYWRNGFHEDGVASALTALRQFKEHHESEQLHLRRAG